MWVDRTVNGGDDVAGVFYDVGNNTFVFTVSHKLTSTPLPTITSAVAVYSRSGLPQLWPPVTKPIPLIIYGATSATGDYTV
ncbi:hypothetical protein F4859DRAFT_487420 [Xylaria cf. heliscus]|nr:hypothetical protein F4859DRAFT_487420 [Xylaria cf. heliscus]